MSASLYPSILRFQNSLHLMFTVHSKLDYYNCLYHILPKYQITQLQQIQNSLARVVVKAPKSSHITPILWSLHWSKQPSARNTSSFNLLTKFLQPPNHHICITSSQFSLLAALFFIFITLAHPSTSSSLRITDCSIQYASPHLWNQLPASLHQPCTNLFNSDSPSSLSGTSSISSIDSPLTSFITLTLSFHA